MMFSHKVMRMPFPTHKLLFLQKERVVRNVWISHILQTMDTLIWSQIWHVKKEFSFACQMWNPHSTHPRFLFSIFFQRGKLHFCLEFLLIVTSSDIHSWLKMRLMHVCKISSWLRFICKDHHFVNRMKIICMHFSSFSAWTQFYLAPGVCGRVLWQSEFATFFCPVTDKETLTLTSLPIPIKIHVVWLMASLVCGSPSASGFSVLTQQQLSFVNVTF